MNPDQKTLAFLGIGLFMLVLFTNFRSQLTAIFWTGPPASAGSGLFSGSLPATWGSVSSAVGGAIADPGAIAGGAASGAATGLGLGGVASLLSSGSVAGQSAAVVAAPGTVGAPV